MKRKKTQSIISFSEKVKILSLAFILIFGIIIFLTVQANSHTQDLRSRAAEGSVLSSTPTPFDNTDSPCKRSGCSGQFCINSTADDIASTCEMRPEYQCYVQAVCERQANGNCGWTQTATLTSCLQNNQTPSPTPSRTPTPSQTPTPTVAPTRTPTPAPTSLPPRTDDIYFMSDDNGYTGVLSTKLTIYTTSDKQTEVSFPYSSMKSGTTYYASVLYNLQNRVKSSTPDTRPLKMKLVINGATVEQEDFAYGLITQHRDGGTGLIEGAFTARDVNDVLVSFTSTIPESNYQNNSWGTSIIPEIQTQEPVIPNAPRWFQLLPNNLRQFLEQLYVTVFIFKRPTSLLHLLQGITPSGSPTPSPTPTPRDVRPSASDWVRGNNGASVALIVYSDLECPFCKTFHPIAQNIISEYRGNVKWIFRHFPLSFHANAQKEAEAAECAGALKGNTTFWAYIDRIYEQTEAGGTGYPLTKLVPLAKELGINETQFSTCLESGRMTQKIQDQMSVGQSQGISGTPGIIVLNTITGKKKVFAGGSVPEIRTAIDELLTDN